MAAGGLRVLLWICIGIGELFLFMYPLFCKFICFNRGFNINLLCTFLLFYIILPKRKKQQNAMPNLFPIDKWHKSKQLANHKWRKFCHVDQVQHKTDFNMFRLWILTCLLHMQNTKHIITFNEQIKNNKHNKHKYNYFDYVRQTNEKIENNEVSQ